MNSGIIPAKLRILTIQNIRESAQAIIYLLILHGGNGESVDLCDVKDSTENSITHLLISLYPSINKIAPNVIHWVQRFQMKNALLVILKSMVVLRREQVIMPLQM